MGSHAVHELRIMLVHGSPRRINEYLFEDRPEGSLERLLDMVDAEVLVCGHTLSPTMVCWRAAAMWSMPVALENRRMGTRVPVTLYSE